MRFLIVGAGGIGGYYAARLQTAGHDVTLIGKRRLIMNMSEVNTEIYNRLHRIYDKHRRKYKKNPDSKQMCCMWSLSIPPDIIDGNSSVQ